MVITCSVAGLCVSRPTDPDRRGAGIGSAELVVVLGWGHEELPMYRCNVSSGGRVRCLCRFIEA